MPPKPKDEAEETRTALFRCKNCGEVNERPFPEVRVVTKPEPCKCGIDSDARIQRAWATAAGIAVTCLVLAGFGTCAADHHYTTEQIKALPEGYRVDRRRDGTMSPDFKVRELTDQEKDRLMLLDTIRKLEAELELKRKSAKPPEAPDGKNR